MFTSRLLYTLLRLRPYLIRGIGFLRYSTLCTRIVLVSGPVLWKQLCWSQTLPPAYKALDADRVLVVPCSYSKLTEEEVKLDRYAKFRALGQFEEHLVPGGQWRETRAARAKVSALLFMLSDVSPSIW